MSICAICGKEVHYHEKDQKYRGEVVLLKGNSSHVVVHESCVWQTTSPDVIEARCLESVLEKIDCGCCVCAHSWGKESGDDSGNRHTL